MEDRPSTEWYQRHTTNFRHESQISSDADNTSKMADAMPNASDIEEVFKQLRAIPTNKVGLSAILLFNC